MAGRNGFPAASGSRTLVVRPPVDNGADYDEADEDVLVARRGAASFGSGDPTFGDLIRDFVRRYGWRAYALPVLLVVTIAALLTARTGTPSHASPPVGSGPGPGSTGSTASAPPVAHNIPLKQDQATGNSRNTVLKNGQLPAGGPFTMRGKGTFHVVPGTSPKVGSGPLFTYEIEVEDGITGVDVAGYARMVQQVLSDPRSWSGHGVTLQRVDSGTPNFHISLTSAMTVRTYCGYTIHVETSCYQAASSVPGLEVNRVFLDVARWVRGAAPYVGDLNAYRIYMINHEDGHALGHLHAHQCLPDGLAPAMMQQTLGLKSTQGVLCQANPWPYPPGVAGAPGHEEPDTSANDEYHLSSD